jgi:pimeloyl-ACP methyl ester carboxylesterase
MLKHLASVALAATLFAAADAAVGADAPVLEIASQGYIFAGGKYVDGPDGKYMSGQAYVEYQIPKNRTHPYPIVMIEGGGQSGSNFTGTPDGREGWAQYFLKQGYAVYVVDQPGRGRSALRPEYGETTQRPTSWVQQQFTAPEKSKLWPQAIAGGFEFSEAAGAQSRCRRGAARQDRSGDPVDPFAVRRFRLADRGRAPQSGEGDRRGRTLWSTGARRRLQGRTELFRERTLVEALGIGCRAAHLRRRDEPVAACLRGANET